jgi:hypothetical protein
VLSLRRFLFFTIQLNTSSFPSSGCRRRPLMPDSERPQDIYVKDLSNSERGYPLYIPTPPENAPEAHKRRGIQIGDVGVFRPNGSFEAFFSAACTEDHPMHCKHGVPIGFSPYIPFGSQQTDDILSAAQALDLSSLSTEHHQSGVQGMLRKPWPLTFILILNSSLHQPLVGIEEGFNPYHVLCHMRLHLQILALVI